MRIEFEIEINEEEAVELSAMLGCSEANLPQILALHFKASAQEFLAMYRGQKVFRRGADILEYRLLLLIETAFNGHIPDEHKVTRLFQTTPSESRALVRSVLAKYQYRIKAAVKRTIGRILSGASQAEDGGTYEAVVNSVNLVDEMNRILADRDGGLAQVKKKRGSVSTYEITPSSFIAISEAVGARNEAVG